MKKLLFMAFLLVSTASWALDKDGNYLNLGSTSCGAYISERNNIESVHYNQTKMWVAGYITAINSTFSDTFNILGSSDLDSAMLWLENYCRAKPLGTLANGLLNLTKELYPRRHKSSKESGR